MQRALDDADCVFFDGTFWSSDELLAAGLGTKRAEEMAHLPIGGPDGSLPVSPASERRARIYIHINNTNPILRDDSPGARARSTPRAGRSPHDGMELRAMTQRRATAARAATSSSTGCGARASAAITITTAITADARREAHARQLQQWVLNRYYYQTRIPIKDAIIVSKSEDPAFRRMWIRRIHDHDGDGAGEGGLALWLRLAEAVGLDREEVASCRSRAARRALRVRRLRRARAASARCVEAVASSLTEFFAPDLMSGAMLAWETPLPVGQPRDAGRTSARGRRARAATREEAIDFVVAHADHLRARRSAAWPRSSAKTEILWHLLDCLSPPTSSRAGDQAAPGLT